jgi:hypothetical protein
VMVATHVRFRRDSCTSSTAQPRNHHARSPRVVIRPHQVAPYVPGRSTNRNEEMSQMRQVQQLKQVRQSRPPELDLCTPSGRRLPF